MKPTTPMQIDEIIREIKAQFRLHMNGVASASMRQKGLTYKLNFGIELPRLCQMAAEWPHDASLAQALWADPTRECKILAAMLMPVREMAADMADLWVEQMPNTEMAGICALHLFHKLPFASQIVLQWIAGESPLAQLTGLYTLSHLLRTGQKFDRRDTDEITDQLQALSASDSYPVAHTAMQLLMELS